jgi:hypothetical protein
MRFERLNLRFGRIRTSSNKVTQNNKISNGSLCCRTIGSIAEMFDPIMRSYEHASQH